MKSARSGLMALGSSQSVILGILCLGVFSTALDQTVVVAALPSVMVDLEIPLTDLDTASWIVTAYLVSYTVAMPLAGRLSDVHGRVRMFQAALVLFSIGSALVAVAPNFPWVVTARVLQAAGGGATVPIGLAMAVGTVEPQKRGVALGLVAASAEAGSVLGPLYGGGIIEWIGWRWIFWLDIPQSFFLIALLAILKNRANPSAKMDYLGALILGGALTTLSLALSQRTIFSGESIVPYFMIALGVVLVGVLIIMERRTRPATAGLIPVQLPGLSVLQCDPVPGRGGADNLPGSGAVDGGYRDGETGLGERPAPVPAHSRNTRGSNSGRLHPAVDGCARGVHNGPGIHRHGPAVHERLGDTG